MDDMQYEAPFVRYHKLIDEYPNHLDDMDDYSMHTYDTFERLKPFKAKEGTTEGDTNVMPVQDND